MKIRISSLPRALLENLQPARVRTGICKALGKEAVESKLCKEMDLRGEESLNAIRDEAKELAQELGLHEEFEQLNAMITHCFLPIPMKVPCIVIEQSQLLSVNLMM